VFPLVSIDAPTDLPHALSNHVHKDSASVFSSSRAGARFWNHMSTRRMPSSWYSEGR
jgi:hypothetical protein